MSGRIPTEGSDNPLEFNPEREQRVRERAYHLWEADGRPHGRDAEFWERAHELEAMSESPGAGQVPAVGLGHVEEAELQANLGEFPDRFADQGEREMSPMMRSKAEASRKAG